MRIRSIKPEFWTDSVIVQLPYEARLLFIGLWNTADDHGWIEDEPDRIKLQILPVDSVDIEATLDLLVATNLLERRLFEDGSAWFYIRNWKKHQRVDHPSKPRCPDVPSRKLAIPPEDRRALAVKYGCTPGERKEVSCHYCGTPGAILWHRLHSGRPSGWVAFTLEVDSIAPEPSDSANRAPNLVLACKYCSASKPAKSAAEFIQDAPPREDSRILAPEREGEREKEREKENRSAAATHARAREDLILDPPVESVAERQALLCSQLPASCHPALHRLLTNARAGALGVCDQLDALLALRPGVIATGPGMRPVHPAHVAELIVRMSGTPNASWHGGLAIGMLESILRGTKPSASRNGNRPRTPATVPDRPPTRIPEL